MTRIEKVLGAVGQETKQAKMKTRNCLANVMNRLKKIKKDTGIKCVFVCLDIGKYGSSSSGLDSKPVIDNLGPVYDSSLSQAVGGGMTLVKLATQH